ncbi:molybdopterin-guanine dinucleotide biosynthesis protein B [Methylomonas sp. AM2-LC]|uniref:molybdopterin-guanine dinucleotide biosynthesis protein B n=1 Tax=Methylomonas sp. AM2-LC TaxID=3153301 RepID=UPI0032670DCC
MLTNQPPVLGFAAFSGAGKTTLLTHILPILNQHGLRVGVIKASHHDFDVDQPGKDSYKLRKAGATPVMLVSPYRRVVITELTNNADLDLATQLAAFPSDGLDLILIEGFREAPIPKIEVHRSQLGKPLLYPNDKHIIAIACDSLLPSPISIPCLDLNNPEQICEYILQHFFAKGFNSGDDKDKLLSQEK